MFNSRLFLSSTLKLTAIFVFAFTGFAQTDLKEAVYGKTKSSTKTGSPATTSSKNKTTKTTPKASNLNAKATPRPIQKRAVKPLLPVTFNSSEAMVEIWLNDKNIGQTDANFQFIKKIAPGEYRLMAKNKRQVLFSKKITINPDQTRFDLFEKTPPVLKVVQQNTDAEQPKEKSELEIAKEVSEKVKKVIETYENPVTTDIVVADDWQLVLQAAQFGQFQGYTAVQMESQKWFASGKIEFAKKEYTNAFTAFNKAREYMPMWAFPYYELGNTYLAKNQLLDAVKLYQKALQVNNKLGMVYKKLGDAQKLANKEKEALTAYELAAQFGYRTYETRYLIATMRIENKQIEKGIEELESLVKEVPKTELYFKLGEAYEKIKQPLSAIENYQKAIELDPNATQAHYRIGGAYMNQREYTRAKESLEKAIALDPAGKILNIKDAQKKLREIATKSNR